jgi:LuxR family maltose regulon positive regulatory protein
MQGASMTRAVAVAPQPSSPGLIEAKLLVPQARIDRVIRTRVLEQLDAAGDRAIISVVAPPGYGKTNLLARWVEDGADSRARFAWVTVDESDNDPLLLFTYIATAIGRLIPIGADLDAGLRSPTVPIRTTVGRLLVAMAEADRPITLVLDDAHELSSHEALDPLAEFSSHLPRGCQVVLAGRTTPDLPLSRWRAFGMLLELGRADLAMNEAEGVRLVRRYAPGLGDAAASGLVRRTEGWPALLALASMAASHPAPEQRTDASGLDRPIADYLREVVLERQDDEVQAFLRRTSVLGRVNGSVCDAIGAGPGSAAALRSLAHSTILIDEYGGWYRYHPLLRELLQGELRARDPGSFAEVHRRAAGWYQAIGLPGEGVEHAFAAGDLDQAATLVESTFWQYHWTARRGILRTWLGRFAEADLRRRPWLATLAAFEAGSLGDADSAERFLDIADHSRFEGRSPAGSSFQSSRAMLRVVMGRGGAVEMLANARFAVEAEQGTSPWRAFAHWVLGLALSTNGDMDAADDVLAEAITAAAAQDAGGIQYSAAGHRAILAIDRGDWALADAVMRAHDGPAVDAVRGYPATAAALAARARLAIRRGDVAEARRALVDGVALRPNMNGLGAYAVQSLISFARAHLAIDDPAGARASILQASAILRRRPGLGILPAQVEAIRAQLADLPLGIGGASTLTPAELRVLALLPYYLSFAEIGERLGVQATTVKSHALAIYGKLGASSRAEAVELAVDVGLLERFPT